MGSIEGFAADARTALTDAGDRASALNAYDAAVRYFRVALELLGEGDTRGPLLLRLGKALALLGEIDFEVLQEAKDELLAAGDEEGAADAETELCDEYWMRGRPRRARWSTSPRLGGWSSRFPPPRRRRV